MAIHGGFAGQFARHRVNRRRAVPVPTGGRAWPNGRVDAVVPSNENAGAPARFGRIRLVDRPVLGCAIALFGTPAAFPHEAVLGFDQLVGDSRRPSSDTRAPASMEPPCRHAMPARSC